MSSITEQIETTEKKIIGARGPEHLDALLREHHVNTTSGAIEAQLQRLGAVSLEWARIQGEDGKFWNVGQANSEIQRLERELAAAGVSPGKSEKYWNVGKANARITELREKLRKSGGGRKAAPAPAAKRPAMAQRQAGPAPAPSPAIQSPTAKKISIQQIGAAAFGDDHVENLEKLFGGNVAKVDARLERNLWVSGLEWPGMNIAELTRLHGPQKELTGFRRVEAAAQQERLDALFENQTKKKTP